MVNPSPKPLRKGRPKTTGTTAKRPVVRRNSGKSSLKKTISLDKLNSNNNCCDVCFDKQKNCAFIPCGHVTCCETCSEKIITDRGMCIICNAEVSSALKIYTT
jgi:E3 ubiquitin-protein ligase mind-bomb